MLILFQNQCHKNTFGMERFVNGLYVCFSKYLLGASQRS